VNTWRLVLEYDGTQFSGWQVQPGTRTVQGELESSLSKLLAGDTVRIIAAGRTDTGVHALGQVVSFRTERKRTERQVLLGVNRGLPKDVRCLTAELVDYEFHANADVTNKLYRYVLRISETDTALRRFRLWSVRTSLDLNAMSQALSLLEGEHDFTTFRASGCVAKSPVRTIAKTSVTRVGDEIWIEVEGRGFLRKMVRNIVGSLYDVGVGKREFAWVGEILAQKNRDLASATAPAQGLYLVRVDY
jgi:tRNA pseudouridine38-40 synthase